MQPDPIVYAQYGPLAEGSVFIYSGVFTKSDGVTPIDGGTIQSITLTLTDLATREVINSRNVQNVLNANQGEFDTAGDTGVFTFRSVNADAPFVRTSPPPDEGDFEIHQMILRWTWVNPDLVIVAGARKIYIVVEKYLGADTPSAGGGSEPTSGILYQPDGATLLEGAKVWVTSDEAGETLVAGPLFTGCNGEYTFGLDPGNYFFWVEADGYTFSNPTAFTVTV